MAVMYRELEMCLFFLTSTGVIVDSVVIWLQLKEENGGIVDSRLSPPAHRLPRVDHLK